MEHSPPSAPGTAWEHAVARDAGGGVGGAEKGGDGPGMMGRFIIPVLVLVGALVRVLALD